MKSKVRVVLVTIAVLALLGFGVAAILKFGGQSSQTKPSASASQPSAAHATPSPSTLPGTPFTKVTALPAWSTDYAAFVPQTLGFMLGVAEDKLNVRVPQEQWRVFTYANGQEPKERLDCKTSSLDVTNGQYPYVMYCDKKFVYFAIAYAQSPPTQEVLLRTLIGEVAEAMNGNSTSTAKQACHAGAVATALSSYGAMQLAIEDLARLYTGPLSNAFSSGRTQGVSACA